MTDDKAYGAREWSHPHLKNFFERYPCPSDLVLCSDVMGLADWYQDAYDALAKRCAELEAELAKIHAGSLWREAIQLRVENAELLQWADRLVVFISKLPDAQYSFAENDEAKQIYAEFHQWREKRGAE